MRLSFEPAEGYLRAEVAGEYSRQAALDAVRACLEEAARLGLRGVLIDSTAVTGEAPPLERFHVGRQIARLQLQTAPGIAIASVGRGPRAERRLAETAAVNRGALFAVFSDEGGARRWLEDVCGLRPRRKRSAA